MFKNILLAIFFATIIQFIGCTTTKILQPRFEESNQVFIERTVDKINLGETLVKTLPSGSKVVLVSMEKEITLDKPIISLIEDQLIQSLSNNGFVVLERDENAVGNLIKESQNEKFSLFQKYDDRVVKDTAKSLYSFLKTNLNKAAYVVSYRILECGLVYRPIAERESVN